MNINGVEYDLRFGIRFLEETQKIYCPKGLDVGTGVITQNVGYGAKLLAAHLKSYTAVPIATCIQCATAHLLVRPSLEDIDEYLISEVEKGKSFEQLCEYFLSLLLNAPLVREGVQQYLQAFDLLEKYQEVKDQAKIADVISFAKSAQTASPASATKRRKKSTSSSTPTI